MTPANSSLKRHKNNITTTIWRSGREARIQKEKKLVGCGLRGSVFQLEFLSQVRSTRIILKYSKAKNQLIENDVFFSLPVSFTEKYIILIYLPGLKYSITFLFIAHMSHIDIPILAVCRVFLNEPSLMALASTSLL